MRGTACGGALLLPILVKTPKNISYEGVSTVAFLPLIIEAYNTPFFTSKILTSFCGVGYTYGSLQTLLCSQLCPSPFSIRSFSLTTSLDDSAL